MDTWDEVLLSSGKLEALRANEERCRLAAEPYYQKLAAMESAEEIRQFLVAEEIKALPGVGNKCAIAQYIRNGSGEEVWVNNQTVNTPFYVSVGPNTAAMRTFIRNFDRGRYPELSSLPCVSDNKVTAGASW
jgi:hypothetical protein